MTIRTTLTAAAVALLVAALPVSAADRRLGEPLDAALSPTPIAEILASPDAWSGKTVRIEGKVAGVCAKQGCWMDLVAPDGARIQVKVDDGVIVFPQDAVDLQAAAEGQVEILDLTRERFEAWLRHAAEEANREFDPAEVGDGPYRIVRLRGRGAEIRGG